MMGNVRQVWQTTIIAVLAIGTGLLPQSRSRADEPKSKIDAKSRHFLLTGQEPPQPFVPLRPRTAEDTEKLEAIKQFCLACRFENERKWNDAIEAYKKAIEHDPKSIALYRSIIQVCRVANRTQDADAFLRQAEEVAPNDFELLSWLGDSLLQKGEFEPAAEYYRRSLNSPNLDMRQPPVVMLKFKLGMISEQAREFTDAAKYYRDVVDAMERPGDYKLNSPEYQQVPFLRNRSDTYEKFSNVFRQAKQYDDALRVLRLAQATQPRGTRFTLNIADVYIDQEKYAQALEYLEKYLNEQTPQGSPAYEKLALVLQRLNRGDEVLPRVEAAAERDRFNSGLQSFLGSLYEEKGDVDRAKSIYLPLLKSSPDTRVYRSLARIYQNENRYGDLMQLLGDGLEKAWDRGFRLDWLPEQLSVLSGDPEVAKVAVDAARQLYQEDAKQFKFGARVLTAWVARAARMQDAAIEFYRAAIDLRPQMPRLHRELGFSLQLSGNTDLAIREVQRAIELDPSDSDNQEALGQIYLTIGQYDKSTEVYEAILKEFSDKPEVTRDARYALSNIYYHLGDRPKAEKMLEEILEQFPDDAAANNDLGYFWAEQGRNLEQAEKMIRKALDSYSAEREQKPWQPEKNSAYLDSMGWVLFKMGRFEEARKYLEEAVAEKEGSEDGTIVEHLGDVYLQLKDPAKAKQLWLRAKEIMENVEGPRREEQKIKDLTEKLKELKD